MVLSRGFDTVFYIPDSGSNERFLIEKWGDVTLEEVKAFEQTLTDPYDKENL